MTIKNISFFIITTLVSSLPLFCAQDSTAPQNPPNIKKARIEAMSMSQNNNPRLDSAAIARMQASAERARQAIEEAAQECKLPKKEHAKPL